MVSSPLPVSQNQALRGRFLALASWCLLAGVAFSQPRASVPEQATEAAAVFNKYCVSCHNAKLKTGGFVLDPGALAHVGENAEIWEKVDRKLRSNTMPPSGLPRPNQATYDSVASWLETELDRSALLTPNAGKLPLLHRLTRSEYQNAIRDLLALDNPPKEMDYSVLLPPDSGSSGFDNIADLLFVSPSNMERYLSAARKISRLAIGDPNYPAMVNLYRIPAEQPQDGTAEDLPIGTRGGLAIRSDFPLDAEYAIRVELAGVAHETHQLEISVDGERKQLTTVGEKSGMAGGGRGGRSSRGKPLEFRIPILAGPRLIGVTFVEHTSARDEETLRPRTRGRGTQPAITTVTISGPYRATGSGDTPMRRRIFVCRPAGSDDELPCATRILSTLARRAYRRPVTDEDLQDLLPFYQQGRKESFEAGIEEALERLLVSPQFLFRIERDPVSADAQGPHRITDLELASRLSFFLWSSIPDDELLSAAAAGKLQDKAFLEAQVRRMLADPRSESMVTNFAAQWLQLRDLQAKRPDELLFPDFDENLRRAFQRETELFLGSVLRENRPVLELLTANYTFLNERLARHYGIPNVEGSYFRRVTLPEGSERAGLLGQGSILTDTSYSVRTSPVVRGKWVLETLLSSPPPPPPPNVPALKTEGSAPGKTLTMREAMIQHRANPACAGCHARMDPIGFAMENFDAVGKWRDNDGGKPIDVSGVLPDGTKLNGISGLKQALLRHPDEFVSTVAEKLLMYAIGRNVQYFDAPAIRAIVRGAAKSNYAFSALVMGVVESVPFQMRQGQAEPSAAEHHAVDSEVHNKR